MARGDLIGIASRCLLLVAGRRGELDEDKDGKHNRKHDGDDNVHTAHAGEEGELGLGKARSPAATVEPRN